MVILTLLILIGWFGLRVSTFGGMNKDCYIIYFYTNTESITGTSDWYPVDMIDQSDCNGWNLIGFNSDALFDLVLPTQACFCRISAISAAWARTINRRQLLVMTSNYTRTGANMGRNNPMIQIFVLSLNSGPRILQQGRGGIPPGHLARSGPRTGGRLRPSRRLFGMRSWLGGAATWPWTRPGGVSWPGRRPGRVRMGAFDGVGRASRAASPEAGHSGEARTKEVRGDSNLHGQNPEPGQLLGSGPK
jgi:hypothetical protein